MTTMGSKSYVYRAEFLDVLPNGDVQLLVDLGFEVQRTQRFRLINMSEKDVPWVTYRLQRADELYVKSYREGELYFSDITYRIGEGWHNLTIDITQAVRHAEHKT